MLYSARVAGRHVSAERCHAPRSKPHMRQPSIADSLTACVVDVCAALHTSRNESTAAPHSRHMSIKRRNGMKAVPTTIDDGLKVRSEEKTRAEDSGHQLVWHGM